MLMLQIPYGSPEVFVGVIPSSPSRFTISDPYDYDGFCGQQSFIFLRIFQKRQEFLTLSYTADDGSFVQR